MQAVAVPNRGRHVGHLETARLALFGRAAQAFEGFLKERLDVVRLQAAGLGAFHLLPDAIDPRGVHHVVGERPLFQQVLQLLPVQRVVQHGRQAGAHLGLIAVADRLDQQIAQGLALELQLAEHVEDLAAEGLAGLLQLLQQPAVDVAFAGLLGHQVPQVAHLGLADAVDAAEALLDAVGVPRQVVVHHQVGTLEVDALARRVGGQQHLHLGIVAERLLRLHALFAAHAAMDHDHGLGAAQQRGDAVLQIVERVAVLGEEHQLLPGRGRTWDRIAG